MFRQAVFDPDQCRIALERQGMYVCGGNFWWQDMLSSPTPGTPLSLSRVVELGKYIFSSEGGEVTPRHLPYMVHVRVPSADYNVMNHKGALQRMSPEEAMHAVLLQCAQSLQDADDAKAQRWREVLLSVTFCFEVVTQEEGVYWRAQALRQQISADYASMRRTARQAAHELALFRKMHEDSLGRTVSPKEVAQAFMAKAKRAKGDGEEFTLNFVEMSLKVHEVLQQSPALAGLLETMEEKYGLAACFNSITKLMELVRRCEDSEGRLWVLNGINDLVEDHKLRQEDITRTTLAGSTHACGLIQLLLVKKKVLHHLLNHEMPKAGFSHGDLELLRDVFSSHSSYRAKLQQAWGDEKAVDVTWVGRLKQSSEKAMRILEDSCNLLSWNLLEVSTGTGHVGWNLLALNMNWPRWLELDGLVQKPGVSWNTSRHA